MYSEDMADACVFLMNLPDAQFSKLLESDEAGAGMFSPPMVNIGVGYDRTIANLADLVKRAVGYQGAITFDTTKADGTPRKLLDVSRLTGLGWQASTPFEQGLASTYESFLSRWAK